MKFPSKETVQRLREQYPKGTRIEIVSMDDPYVIMPPGLRGSVDFVDDTGSLLTTWDNGSHLAVIYGVDQVKIVTDEKEHGQPAPAATVKRPAPSKPPKSPNRGR